MPDYPDWERAIRLIGSDIVLEIKVDATVVNLPVSIDAQAVDIDVNLSAQAVTLDINFLDQAVAVFDAAKWFAHQAVQVFVYGSASVTNNNAALVATRTVPTGKTFFIVGVSNHVLATALPNSTHVALVVAGVTIMVAGSRVGVGIIFDTPVRATAGQLVGLWLGQYGSGATLTLGGGFWGYDE